MKISIVAACYNVSRYIDGFFSSIINQTIDFEKNISVICVDDGSIDETKNKISAWQIKYPKNILYIYQSNSGQAEARNTGIKFCSDSEWVIFTDPDDSFSCNFFEEMLRCAHGSEVAIVCSRTIFFYEDQQKTSDTHPLRYRFFGVSKEKISNLNRRIIPAANSSLFRVDIIKKYHVSFDPRVRPTFEDSLFVLCYLHYCGNHYACFCKSAKYFYTKRATRDSAIDISKRDPKRYYDQLLFGNLEALSRFGNDASYVKLTVLYDISWLFKYIFDRKDRVNFLSDEQVQLFEKLTEKIFSYYSVEDVEKFNIIQIPIQVKLGICFRFLNRTDRIPTAVVEEFDHYKGEIKIHFWSPIGVNEYFLISDNRAYKAIDYKTVSHTLGRSLFLLETVAWFTVPRDSAFGIIINGKQATLIWDGKGYFSLKCSDLRRSAKVYPMTDAPWLFIDRDKCADDNAEHFYRWVSNNTDRKKIFFVLNRNSSDWNRLSAEGFQLVEYGSAKHKQILSDSSLIISSQVDSYVYKFDGKSYLNGKRMVFLQHGVIKDDLSEWINAKPKISLMLTSTLDEYNSIVGNDSLYLLTRKEVKLLGLPRFESLKEISRRFVIEKTILVMPTWRKDLIVNGLAGEALLERFLASEFYKRWNLLLSSKSIRDFVKSGYTVIFKLHPCLEIFKEKISLPTYVTLVDSQSDISVQELFAKSEFLITDYSSVAFDFASMYKLVFYYQFDSDSFFASHTYCKGYFDYIRDGFGPVSHSLIELEEYLSQYLLDNESLKRKYFERFAGKIESDNCCAELYSELVRLICSSNKHDLTSGSETSYETSYKIKNGPANDVDNLFYTYLARDNYLIKFESLILRLFCAPRMYNKYKTNRVAFFSDSKSRTLNAYIYIVFLCSRANDKVRKLLRVIK